MRAPQSALLAVLVVAVYAGAALAAPKPPSILPYLKHMDPVDACLFACSMCYSNDFLLECANSVCLMDLSSGKPLGRFWSKTCPGLEGFFKM